MADLTHRQTSLFRALPLISGWEWQKAEKDELHCLLTDLSHSLGSLSQDGEVLHKEFGFDVELGALFSCRKDTLWPCLVCQQDVVVGGQAEALTSIRSARIPTIQHTSPPYTQALSEAVYFPLLEGWGGLCEPMAAAGWHWLSQQNHNWER